MKTSPLDWERLLSPTSGAHTRAPGGGLITGRFAGIDSEGRPMVHVAVAQGDLTRTKSELVAPSDSDPGAQAGAAPDTRPEGRAVPALVLASAAGDLATAQPGDFVLLARVGDSDPELVLLGLLVKPGAVAAMGAPAKRPSGPSEPQNSNEPAADTSLAVRLGRGEREARLDGKTVSLEAQDEIVLKCGRSSLTLRRNGEVVLRGVRVLSRASQTQRIRGASVQIN